MVVNYPSFYLVRMNGKTKVIKDFKKVKDYIDFDHSKSRN